jgi:hypothetical protein
VETSGAAAKRAWSRSPTTVTNRLPSGRVTQAALTLSQRSSKSRTSARLLKAHHSSCTSFAAGPGPRWPGVLPPYSVFPTGSSIGAWNRRVRPVKGASGIRSKSMRCNCANGNVASASLAASIVAHSNINTTLPGSLARV